ncbi:MAG TPA: RluA family pseudouridine synthase [Candidatus Dojkabacteria bacterium]|mgnify:CR=1 FL=1|nr:RluA family pseudouridine synthase [Candidatus Dojkabacteria bacterium]
MKSIEESNKNLESENNDTAVESPNVVVGKRLDLTVFEYIQNLGHQMRSKSDDEIYLNKDPNITISVINTEVEIQPRNLEKVSRSLISNNINSIVLVNNHKEKRGYKLRKNDVVTIDLSGLNKILDQSIKNKNLNSGIFTVVSRKGDLDIVFEDKNLLVINKKAGVSVHPGISNLDNTLANYVRYYLEDKSEFDNQVVNGGIVHRLDKCTSGLIIFAKNHETQTALKQMFKGRKIVKGYIAQIEENASNKQSIYLGGYIKRDKVDRRRMKYFPLTIQNLETESKIDILGDIEYIPVNQTFIYKQFAEILPLAEAKSNAQKTQYNNVGIDVQQVSQNDFKSTYSPRGIKDIDNTVKHCETLIAPISINRLLIYPITGRNHQIRAVLREIGYHIVGDTLYKSKREGEIPEEISLKCVYLRVEEYGDGLEISSPDYKTLQ